MFFEFLLVRLFWKRSLVVVIALGFFLLGVAFRSPSLGPPVIAEDSYQYYRDSVTFLAQDAVGTPLLMDLDFNRKEHDGNFTHYYSGTLWYGDEEEEFSTQFISEGTDVQAHDYLEECLFTPFLDLSTRANHELILQTDFGELVLNVQTEGDFLTKDSLDYTRFSSVSLGTLSFGGEALPAQVLWETAYSKDYRHYIFFDGREDLDSEAHVYTLWDDEGDFYHIDQSEVEDLHENYASHTWVLYKKALDGSAQKAFEAEIISTQEGVQIELPNLNSTLSLKAPTHWDRYEDSGLIGGVITLSDGSQRAVEGFFKNALY